VSAVRRGGIFIAKIGSRWQSSRAFRASRDQLRFSTGVREEVAHVTSAPGAARRRIVKNVVCFLCRDQIFERTDAVGLQSGRSYNAHIAFAASIASRRESDDPIGFVFAQERRAASHGVERGFGFDSAKTRVSTFACGVLSSRDPRTEPKHLRVGDDVRGLCHESARR